MDLTAPDAFKKVTRLSQHIAFLKDFFRAYKDFNDAQIDTIEILLSKLYARFGITDSTDYSTKGPTDFPIMEDFYKLCEEEFYGYDTHTVFRGGRSGTARWPFCSALVAVGDRRMHGNPKLLLKKVELERTTVRIPGMPGCTDQLSQKKTLYLLQSIAITDIDDSCIPHEREK